MQILCKSQQKVYNTFTDELSDYIQIQKARGIAQKPPVFPAGAAQKDGDWEREGDIFPERELNFPLNYIPPHPSCYGRGRGCPSYPGHSWPPQGLLDGGSPLAVTGSALPQLPPSHFLRRKRLRKPPSCPPHEAFSSSHSSSYSSSSSSSTSDSGDSKYRHSEKRRLRKSRRERGKRAKEEDSDKEEKSRKRRRTEKHKELGKGRRGESGGSEEEERRRKGGKGHGRSREKKARVDPEAAAGESWKQENVKHDKGDLNVEQRDSEQDEPGRAKNRREKKKGREDTRTEEEKLWDDCILGF